MDKLQTLKNLKLIVDELDRLYDNVSLPLSVLAREYPQDSMLSALTKLRAKYNDYAMAAAKLVCNIKADTHSRGSVLNAYACKGPNGFLPKPDKFRRILEQYSSVPITSSVDLPALRPAC